MFIEHTYTIANKNVSAYLTKEGTKSKLYFKYQSEKETRLNLVHTFSLDTVVSIKGEKIQIKTFKKRHPVINTLEKTFNNGVNDICNLYIKRIRLYFVHFPCKFILNEQYLQISNFRGRRANIKIKKVPNLQLTLLQPDYLEISGVSRINVMNYIENIRQKLATRLDSRIFIDTIMVE